MTDNKSKSNIGRNYITVPYIKALVKASKTYARSMEYKFTSEWTKPSKTSRWHMKIKTINQKSGIIYRYTCDRLECDEEYIGELVRTFGERFREHLKTPSPIYDHCNTTGHNTALDNFSIVGREDHKLMRLIKESI